MGFLLGAFGKLAAGSRYRNLQARLMRVQSRLRRATRNVADMQKSLEQQKKAELNYLTLGTNSLKLGAQALLQSQASGIQDYFGLAGMGSETVIKQLDQTQIKQLNDYQMGMSALNSNMEQWVAVQKQQIEDKYSYLEDIQLEPLKDEEDNLQLEKDTLESQLQIAKADYEACQKMEQSDAKMMQPNYTGGQG